MKVLLSLCLMSFATSTLFGEILPYDTVRTAWCAAGKGLSQGRNRTEIAAELEAEASKHPQSWWYKDSMALSQALKESDRRLEELKKAGTPVEKAPWAWLADSRMERAAVTNQPENAEWLRRFMKENPQDPASLLITRGRRSIENLVPMLMDMAPTRHDLRFGWSDECPAERTSDLALAIVEYLSGCSFCEDTFSQGQFSKLPEATRLCTQREAEAWWKEYGQAGLSEGIRARFPQAGYYGKVKMARRLAETGVVADRAFARAGLRQLIDSTKGYRIEYPANALWDMGDSYALEAAHKRLRTCLAEGVGKFIADSSGIWFLMAHGGRAEWETLTQYADAQLTSGQAGDGYFIWSSLVGSGDRELSPYAIPALALAVTKGRHLHSMPRPAPTNDGTQIPSLELQTAWKAANRLQKLTGKNFGITDTESGVKDMERNLDKVQAWWEAEGRTQYSFDMIQRKVATEEHAGK